jgi:hypothetical protein
MMDASSHISTMQRGLALAKDLVVCFRKMESGIDLWLQRKSRASRSQLGIYANEQRHGYDFLAIDPTTTVARSKLRCLSRSDIIRDI